MQEYDGLFRAVPNAYDAPRLLIGAGARQDQRADIRLRNHALHDGDKGIARGVSGNVGGVRRPAEAFENGVYAFARGVRKRGQRDAGVAEIVGGQRAYAAGVGYERRAALLGRVEVREHLRGLQQPVPIVNAGYAVLREGGVINLVRAGEGGGVGLRGARPKRGAPYLHRRNRLAALGGEFRHFQKLARVPKALYEHGYGFRVRVIKKIAREVGRVKVGFVAGGYDV